MHKILGTLTAILSVMVLGSLCYVLIFISALSGLVNNVWKVLENVKSD